MKLSDRDFREKAKKMAEEILYSEVKQIGDTGMGGCCNYCGKWCRWDQIHSAIEHHPDCIINTAREIFESED